jgi:hypothetical protein
MTPGGSGMTATVGDGWCQSACLTSLEKRLFVHGKGPIGPASQITSKLGPGDFLWAPQLGPWTALALWDPNASAASLGVFNSGVAEVDIRLGLHEMLELGASFSTLRFAAVGSPENVSLPRVWSLLERRLRPAPLPPSDRASPVAGPRNVFAGNCAYLVFNGVGEWLGEPAIRDP